MSIAPWSETTIDGTDYLVMPSVLRVPVNFDPSSNVFVAVAAPGTGIASFPAVAAGPPGTAATITAVNLTALDYMDPTPDAAALTATSPGIYTLDLTLHTGAPGADGTTTFNLSAYGTPVAGQILVVDPGASTLLYQYQKVGARYIPATVSPVPSGNPNYTLCPIPVPAQNFDWRPRVRGWTVVTGTGPNVAVDLVARLNNETAGNIVARGTQPAGQYPATHQLVAGPPAGSADGYDRVSAGAAAVLYVRTERQSGSDSYTTTAAQSLFSAEVMPI